MPKTIENLTKRKPTGGRTKPYRGRRAREADSYPIETVLGTAELVRKRSRGGNEKLALRRAAEANVYDPSAKTASKVKIVAVIENKTSRDYQRRGVITRGALIQTEAGNARVTSRPGQDGVINAVLLK